MQLRHDSLFAVLLRVTLAGICLPALCDSERRGYLFVSSVTDQAVYNACLLDTLEQANSQKMQATKLTAAGQVTEPRGLAVDYVRKVLYVMDTGKSALLALRLQILEGGVKTSEPVEVVTGIGGHWVTVDSAGTVFYTDKSKIWSVDGSTVRALMDGSAEEDSASATQQSPLYNDETLQQVNTPQGLAVDGHYLYWANGANGQQDGVLNRGLQAPEIGNEGNGISQLAVNADLANGVCVTSSRVFYTAAEKQVYSTKIGGGSVVTVSDRFQKPQGCAYDGDGTIFVADEQEGKVYSFSGGGLNLGPRRVATALEVPGAFGLAVLQLATSGATLPPFVGAVALAVSLVFVFS